MRAARHRRRPPLDDQNRQYQRRLPRRRVARIVPSPDHAGSCVSQAGRAHPRSRRDRHRRRSVDVGFHVRRLAAKRMGGQPHRILHRAHRIRAWRGRHPVSLDESALSLRGARLRRRAGPGNDRRCGNEQPHRVSEGGCRLRHGIAAPHRVDGAALLFQGIRPFARAACGSRRHPERGCLREPGAEHGGGNRLRTRLLAVDEYSS